MKVARVILTEELHSDDFLEESDICTGDVLFMSGDDLESSVVKMATGSRWSHCAVAVWLSPSQLERLVTVRYKYLEKSEIRSTRIQNFKTITPKIKYDLMYSLALDICCELPGFTGRSPWDNHPGMMTEVRQLYLWESTTAEGQGSRCHLTGNIGKGAKLTLMKERGLGYSGPMGIRHLITTSSDFGGYQFLCDLMANIVVNCGKCYETEECELLEACFSGGCCFSGISWFRDFTYDIASNHDDKSSSASTVRDDWKSLYCSELVRLLLYDLKNRGMSSRLDGYSPASEQQGLVELEEVGPGLVTTRSCDNMECIYTDVSPQDLSVSEIPLGDSYALGVLKVYKETYLKCTKPSWNM